MRPVDPALLRALPATRGPVLGLATVGVLSGVVAIAQAVLLGLVVATVVGADAPAGWRPLLLALVATLALRGALAGLTEVLARRAGLRVTALVRLATLRHWLALPEGRRPATDVALARSTEGVDALEAYVARYLPALVTGVVVPALALLSLLVVDPWSALIVALTLPLLPVFAALIGMHTRDETQARWGAMARLAGHFLDVVRGLPTLVTYGRARAQVDVVREVGERHRRATVATLRTAFLSTAALELLATISVAMVAVAVGLRLAHGAMGLTVGMVAILLAPEAYWPVRRVGQEFHNAADGAAVLEQLGADGVLGPGMPRPTSSHPHLVTLERVSYAHPGRERTLVDLDLSTPAPPGLTALVGPSGAGKTTALELLAGLRAPDDGRVLAPAAHLATQRPVLLPGTVRDNLLLAVDGRPPGDAELREALVRVGLWGQLAGREGLDTVLGEDGFGLSAGQRARLALARALLSAAPLLLLDEPTANVAAASLPALHTVIRELAAARRVVVVTHDQALAALADEVWRLAPAPLPTRRRSAVSRPATTGDARSAQGQPHETLGGGRGNQAARSVGLGATTRDARWEKGGGRWGLVGACLLGGAAVGCGVALTATSGWLIVQASTQPVILTLMVAIVGVRAFGIFRPALRYAERVVSHDVALRDLAGRRAEVFARLVPLTPARLGRRNRGELLTAVVRDLDDVVDEQVRVTVPAWSAVIASVVGAALAGAMLPAAGLAVAAGAALTALVAATGHHGERAAQARAVALRGEVHQRTTALVSRLLPVQAVSGLTADRVALLAPLARAQEDQARAEGRLIRARATTLALAWLVVAATTAAVTVLTAAALSTGRLTAPVAAMVALVPMALADTWVGAADIAGARARARAAAARLEQVLGQTPAVADRGRKTPPLADGTGTPYLRLERVGARWSDAASDAELDLTPLDLDLPPGTRVRLTGPNGAGKSTALAVLARHLDPATGRHRVDDADALDLELEPVRQQVAVVDDEPHAFAGSVRANLALAAPDATDDQLLRALEAADLGHWFDTLPEGLDTPLTGLSGGERARLSIARAVVSARPVVLLDEPTAHLDDATAERALAGLEAAHAPGSGTLVQVTHRAGETPGWREVHVGTGPRAGA